MYNWSCKYDRENGSGRCHHFKVEFTDKSNKPMHVDAQNWSRPAENRFRREQRGSRLEFAHTDEETWSWWMVYGVIICVFCDSFLLCQTTLVVRLASGQFVIDIFPHLASAVTVIFGVMTIRLRFVLTHISFRSS